MDVIMPQLGETVTEGTVIAWHKKVGDAVKADENLFDVETDKVTAEIPAPAAGVLKEILVAVGTTVAVGARLAVIETAGATVAQSAAAAAPGAAPTVAAATRPPAAPGEAGELPLSPVVRRLIAEHGLDPARIRGTGRGGRITREDVLAALETGGGATAPAAPAGRAPQAEVVPLSRIRKQIAAHMVRSKATSPHVLQAVEVDFYAVEAARQARGEDWRRREGFGLTYLPFIARAVIDAIAEFPRVNASIDGDNLIVHKRVNLGVAVDLNFEGLMAPVVKDAQSMRLADIARAMNALATRARNGSIGADDLAGGTYTLSNSGPFGTLITAPIINQPQVAILSTDGVRKKPVVIETAAGDAIAIRPIGVLAQSFDHRAIDGAYSAAFLRRLRELIETRDWLAELG
ncbi:MAG: 2-oxo acid dehydrogenase subunit E2 [Burkholderiales bacterium]|nr:2-oxo acid dehydrogenase subunit E2 [Burkholderiales bacterium]